MESDRRYGPYDRRSVEDWRLDTIESLLEALQDELSLKKLDERYMPRTEMERAYVPREEHLASKTLKGDVHVKLFMAMMALGQFGIAITVLVSK